MLYKSYNFFKDDNSNQEDTTPLGGQLPPRHTNSLEQIGNVP